MARDHFEDAMDLTRARTYEDAHAGHAHDDHYCGRPIILVKHPETKERIGGCDRASILGLEP